MSWHLLHSGCQLLLSQNRFLLPLCGMMWSVTVAAVSLPCLWHSKHHGFLSRNFRDSICHLLLYPRLCAFGLSCLCIFVCSKQYGPSDTLGHPGCLHGVSGFLGIGHHPFLILEGGRKEQTPTLDGFGLR